MKQHLLVLLITTLSFLSIASAQAKDRYPASMKGEIHYGIRAGLNFPARTSVSFRPVIGAFGEFGLARRFSLSVEADYSREAIVQSCPEHTVLEVGYINLPILANFYVARGFAIKVGLQPGLLVHSVTSSPLAALYSPSIAVPFGLSYCFNFGLFVDARANFLNINFTKPYYTYQMILGQISIGYRF